ncbi:hypothetical protein [Cetobacterium sp. SF1]|uniref:hypothetical protein n=1 Tax=Cetobacterium sp. SF1 TaxID=3417654 RepID=UPI003CE69877
MGKNKGFTNIEVLIGILICIIIFSYVSIKIKNLNEILELKKDITYSVNCYYKYTEISINNSKKYKINNNLKEGIITITEGENKIPLEIIKLNSKLRRTVIYNNRKLEKIDSYTTINGNLSNSFSIYFFNRKNKAAYRIAFYPYTRSKILRINVYRNKDAEAYWENILEYHKENEGRFDGWIKEKY